MNTYREILAEIVNACNYCFHNGASGIHDTCVKAAAEIYIAQLKIKDGDE